MTESVASTKSTPIKVAATASISNVQTVSKTQQNIKVDNKINPTITVAQPLIINQASHQVVKLPKPSAELDPFALAKAGEMLEGVDTDEIIRTKRKAVEKVVNLVIPEAKNIASTESRDSITIPIAENENLGGHLTSLYEALIILFLLLKENRRLGIAQRKTAVAAQVASLQAQASELRKNFGAQVAVAVVTAVATAVSFALSAYNVVVGARNLKEIKVENDKMGAEISTLGSLKDSLKQAQNDVIDTQNEMNQAAEAINELTVKVNAGTASAEDMADLTTQKSTLNQLQATHSQLRKNLTNAENDVGQSELRVKTIENIANGVHSKVRTHENRAYAFNIFGNGLTQVIGAVGGAVRAHTDAAVKELEADHAQMGLYAEIARERLGSDEQLMRDTASNFKSISEQMLQAWRQATNLV